VADKSQPQMSKLETADWTRQDRAGRYAWAITMSGSWRSNCSVIWRMYAAMSDPPEWTNWNRQDRTGRRPSLLREQIAEAIYEGIRARENEWEFTHKCPWRDWPPAYRADYYDDADAVLAVLRRYTLRLG
jgi:hypothetical protein